MITGNADVTMAVQAMKAGALDFIEKPIGREELLVSVERALEHSQDASKLDPWTGGSAEPLAGLTERQKRSWSWFSPATPARISPPISASANARSRTIAPRS